MHASWYLESGSSGDHDVVRLDRGQTAHGSWDFAICIATEATACHESEFLMPYNQLHTWMLWLCCASCTFDVLYSLYSTMIRAWMLKSGPLFGSISIWTDLRFRSGGSATLFRLERWVSIRIPTGI